MIDMSRRGLTLLEVLCATALASLLMVAVMSVVAGLARLERTLAEPSDSHQWGRHAARLIAVDMAAADSVSVTPDHLVLHGPLSTGTSIGERTWAEAQVTYRLEESPLGLVLVRIEQQPPPVAARQIDTLVIGCGSWTLFGSSRDTSPVDSSNAREFSTDLVSGDRPAQRLTLRVFDHSGALLCREVVHAL